MSTRAAPRPTDDDAALRRATLALQDTINAALAAHPKLAQSLGDLTTATLRVEAPYAREVRLLVATIAASHIVLAIGTPEVAGKYARGVDVTLYGFQPHLTAALADIDRIVGHAREVAAQSSAAPGEDTATHRGSVIGGYRLGLARPALDAEQVAALVAAPDPGGLRVGSTGSGSYTGYLAAQTATTTPPHTAHTNTTRSDHHE